MVYNEKMENSLESDLAWKGLKDVFKLGIYDLSEKVDDILYGEKFVAF